MKQKFIDLYMNWAQSAAKMSHACRRQVGAVIVKDDTVISYGYNGMPAGWDNNCEDRVYNSRFKEHPNGEWMDPLTYQVIDINNIYPYVDEEGNRYYLKTKPEVLHAESNAVAKLAKSTNSGEGADLFVTTAPCLDCAKLIHQAGIKRVWFGDDYRDNSGLTFLEKSGIIVEQVK